jgi:hypothetical protein
LDKRAAEEARKALLRKVGIGAALGTGGIAAAILAKKAADEDDAKREAMYEAMYGDGGYR